MPHEPSPLSEVLVPELLEVVGGQGAAEGECLAALSALAEEQQKLGAPGSGGGQGRCRDALGRVAAACTPKAIEELRARREPSSR